MTHAADGVRAMTRAAYPPTRVVVRTTPALPGFAVCVTFKMSSKNDHRIVSFTDANGLVDLPWREVIRQTARDVDAFVMDYVSIDSPAFAGVVIAEVMSREQILAAIAAIRNWPSEWVEPNYRERLVAALWASDGAGTPKIEIRAMPDAISS